MKTTDLLNNKYNLVSEYKINIEEECNKIQITNAVRLFENFITGNFKKIDLEKLETIDEVYEEAQNNGIFSEAEKIRNLIFGKDIHFYGVCYLWDACVNYCVYCPGSVQNRKEALKNGREYPLRKLRIEQFVKEAKAIKENGHTHICLLAGSAPGRNGLPKKIFPYLEAIDNLGFTEIILNIEPPTYEGLKLIRSAVKQTSLQFRVFQETYNKETYGILHPKGPKSDYDFRFSSQGNAIKAGFNNIGLGVLFGLHQFPLEEIYSLKQHLISLKTMYDRDIARICLPSANELKNIGIEIPYYLPKGEYSNNGQEIVSMGKYEKFNELLYALARLYMPTINIVSSERDKPAMLKVLDKYATCTTLNVHSGVGDNSNIYEKHTENEIHFEQTTDYPRNVDLTINDMIERGYNPVLNSH